MYRDTHFKARDQYCAVASEAAVCMWYRTWVLVGVLAALLGSSPCYSPRKRSGRWPKYLVPCLPQGSSGWSSSIGLSQRWPLQPSGERTSVCKIMLPPSATLTYK